MRLGSYRGWVATSGGIWDSECTVLQTSAMLMFYTFQTLKINQDQSGETLKWNEKWKRDTSEARAEINAFLSLAQRRQDGFPYIWVCPWETPSGGWHTWGPVLGLGWNRTRKGYFSTLFSGRAWKMWEWSLRAAWRKHSITADSLPFRG